MVILGIDPGIGRTGWGVIETQSGKCKAKDFGCFETEPNSPMDGRLKLIFAHISRLISEHQPEAMAIEELFFNTNAKTALTVGHARGVIILAAALQNVPVISYTPLQVKIGVTGYGRAEKKQVGDMVKMTLGLTAVPKPDDTADALAIALTHAFSSKIPRR
jgi:crossover junction endodeoxyribonuclease RuvC